MLIGQDALETLGAVLDHGRYLLYVEYAGKLSKTPLKLERSKAGHLLLPLWGNKAAEAEKLVAQKGFRGPPEVKVSAATAKAANEEELVVDKKDIPAAATSAAGASVPSLLEPISERTQPTTGKVHGDDMDSVRVLRKGAGGSSVAFAYVLIDSCIQRDLHCMERLHTRSLQLPNVIQFGMMKLAGDTLLESFPPTSIAEASKALFALRRIMWRSSS